ncbi:MAG: copper homeostasis protein CutC, partial [Candidatus Bathyarchaeota archaeon]|nr:copper homeostasis protein CutC [Candidatus Bathyarchaeota archaeon]
PGAGLTPENIKEFHNRVKAREYHSTLSEVVDSVMMFRREDVYMGGLSVIPEYSWKQASAEKIQKFLNELK